MKYYLIAGEASGDLHASNLMTALKTEDADAHFRYFGGDLMQAVGGTLVKHYREMAYMGVIPVLLNIRSIMKNMQLCREDLRSYQPDSVILVDYPGFNLKIAEFVKKQLNIPVYYYISPKIWAWKKYRIKSIRLYVDRMFCILPFEVDFYKSLNFPVDYVGNPSVDSVAAFYDSEAVSQDVFIKMNRLSEKPLLAILAGSRKSEIKQNLPTMLLVAKRFPEFQSVIAGAPGLTPDDYNSVIAGDLEVKIVFGQTYQILANASYALVTSGTATLETALFRVPQVVCYYFTGRIFGDLLFKFFHVKYISLVNLIAGYSVVKELFGVKFSSKSIYDELFRLSHDNTYRSKMLEGYEKVISAIGKPGATKCTAQRIAHSIKNQK